MFAGSELSDNASEYSVPPIWALTSFANCLISLVSVMFSANKALILSFLISVISSASSPADGSLSVVTPTGERKSIPYARPKYKNAS